MMLTGKAKEDFYYYVFNNIKEQLFGDLQDVYDYIYSLPISCKNALIIEWFDSVGIYTDAQMVSGFDFENNKVHSPVWFMNVFSEDDCCTDDVEVYPSRREATKQAIKKANQIYNESKD